MSTAVVCLKYFKIYSTIGNAPRMVSSLLNASALPLGTLPLSAMIETDWDHTVQTTEQSLQQLLWIVCRLPNAVLGLASKDMFCLFVAISVLHLQAGKW